MSIRLIAVFAAFAVMLLSTACSSRAQGEMTPSPTPFVSTSTRPATGTTFPLETALPSAPSPIIAPVDGITSTQVNVRAEPSTAGIVLGIIPADMRVEITGQDPGGNWWQINYSHPEAIDGKGWVTSQYVTMPTAAEVPVIGGPQEDANAGAVAVIQQQINVRSGPGTDFNSLGTLNPEDVVSLTGKDPNGGWLQIDFANGPEGKGWVSAAFVQAQGVENLPIVAESGMVVGTGTPTSVPPTPTPTVIPAREDHDSAGSPIASVIFEPTGIQTFMYSGDLSAPQGDPEDWIAFMPYDQVVFVSLECRGNDRINVQLLKNNSPIDTYIKCGSQMEQLAVMAGSTYVLHLEAVASGEILQYTNYILTIKSRP